MKLHVSTKLLMEMAETIEKKIEDWGGDCPCAKTIYRWMVEEVALDMEYQASNIRSKSESGAI